MDKERLLQERGQGSPWWIYALCCLMFVWAAGFMAVAVITFQNMSTLDDNDIKLKSDIARLIQDLEVVAGAGVVEIAQSSDVDIADLTADPDKAEHSQKDDSSSGAQTRLGQRSTRSVNIVEEILKAQEKVFEKYCHSWNATCPPGARGDNGTAGSPGLPGRNGTAGLPGTKGQSGDPGTPGSKGETGDQGLSGDAGSKGPIGQTGQKGATGQNGNTGSNGPPGLKGVQGAVGQKGPTGPAGPAGLHGFAGTNGTKGVKGDTGVNGTRGNTGPPGDKGQDVKKIADGCKCLRKPTFRSALTSIRVPAQRNIPLPCEAMGDPKPKLTVSKLQHNGRKRTMHVNGAGATIADLRKLDMGTYLCEASNTYGSINKTLTVTW